MISKTVVILLSIIIAVLAIWLRILANQVNALYDAYNELCTVIEMQSSNMKKIVQNLQDQSTYAHDIIESFAEMIERVSTKDNH